MTLAWYLWVALIIALGFGIHDLVAIVINARIRKVNLASTIGLAAAAVAAFAIIQHGVSP